MKEVQSIRCGLEDADALTLHHSGFQMKFPGPDQIVSAVLCWHASLFRPASGLSRCAILCVSPSLFDDLRMVTDPEPFQSLSRFLLAFNAFLGTGDQCTVRLDIMVGIEPEA